MGEDDDGRAAGQARHVVLQPEELVRAQVAHRFGLEGEDIDQPDEMHPAVVEGVPAAPFRALAVALQVQLAAVADDIVFAGDIEHLPRPRLRAFEDLIHGVELVCLGKLAQVARVQDEGGRRRQGVDLGDGLLKGADDVFVGGLVEPDVAVTDLDEVPVLARRGGSILPELDAGRQEAAAHLLSITCPCPPRPCTYRHT